jgi:hypothetical protein
MPLPDVDDLDTFGGARTNYSPKIDPTTDVGSEDINPCFANVAMMTHTVERAWVKFNGHTYVGPTDTISVVDHDAVWGSGTGVKPAVSQTDANTFVITWTATQNDLLAASHTLNIRRPSEPLTIDTALSKAKVTAFTANTITIKTFNAAGSANGLSGIPIIVGWR